MQCHVCVQSPPSHGPAHHTAPDLCKKNALQYYLVATIILIQSLLCQICIHTHAHTHTYSSQYRDAGWSKEMKKIGTAVKAVCHRFVSLGLLASICPPVRLFTYVISASKGQIFVKFDIGNFHLNLMRKSIFG